MPSGIQPDYNKPLPANDNEPLPAPISRHRRLTRKCLQCGARFRSQGSFNRICDACKVDEYWQSSEDLTLNLPPLRQVAL